ncbi:MAG TPA: phosphoribosylamine--glycine ligase [Steroidobacteraceae bacterium]|jgi:phosphoribosylamine--glycine ligase|nr:phosphoribosylamine--glycine ligase [Steroidobacteraceae bacterium]
MKVLVVGGGGREHALAWACARSARVSEVLVAPGNAGTALEPRVRNVEVAASDLGGLVRLARRERPDLTIVGPEAPLVAGIVDIFESAGYRCFGPRQRNARLEGSKVFAKEFLQRYAIPTAAWRRFTAQDYDGEWVRSQRAPLVVKASGLASGKGVVIAESAEQADASARAMLGGRFGEAGAEIVIEEFLAGEELSFIVMADGRHVLPLASSQDHKRLGDGDRGPNTGGMGAYSPAPVLDEALHARVMHEIIEPTIAGLAQEGTPYIGFLYAGLMIGADGAPRVLEFNCRLGDPETQPLLARLRSDLIDLCEAALDARLHEIQADWDARSALGVVLAAAGYPEAVRTGDLIAGLEQAATLPGKVFHAGTLMSEHGVLTHGGRVLCAVGLGASIHEAQQQAYALADCIRFPGMQLRRDIGYRALARSTVELPTTRSANR